MTRSGRPAPCCTPGVAQASLMPAPLGPRHGVRQRPTPARRHDPYAPVLDVLGDGRLLLGREASPRAVVLPASLDIAHGGKLRMVKAANF